MDEVKILQMAAGVWQAQNVSWDQVLRGVNPPQAQIIFTSARTIANAPQKLRSCIFERFRMPAFLFDRIYLESNGLSGCESIHDENQGLTCYNYWSRFIVKQTHKELRPKSSFTRYDSTGEKGNFPYPNTPIHGPRSIKNGWSWYEMGFFVHWTPPHSTTLLCFDLPGHMKVSLQSALSSSMNNTDLSDPYFIFSIVLSELLSVYNDSVWSLRNHVCNVEAARLPDPNYPLLHEIARHAIHVSETLSVALESIKTLQQQHQDFLVQYLRRHNRWNRIHNHFHFQLRFLHGLLLRSESNKARIQNEITLAFHMAAQNDTKIQLRIGEEAQKETTAMKAIAVVTMTFLPATFVSSIFSMSFFHFEPASGGNNESFTVSNKFWMYWVFAAPLYIAAVGLWILWDGKLRRR